MTQVFAPSQLPAHVRHVFGVLHWLGTVWGGSENGDWFKKHCVTPGYLQSSGGIDGIAHRVCRVTHEGRCSVRELKRAEDCSCVEGGAGWLLQLAWGGP